MATRVEVQFTANILDIIAKFAQLKQEAAKLKELGNIRISPRITVDQSGITEALRNNLLPISAKVKLTIIPSPIDVDTSNISVASITQALNAKIRSITAPLKTIINLSTTINTDTLTIAAIRSAINSKIASVGDTSVNKKATIVINPIVDTSKISSSGIDSAIRRALATIDSLKTKFSTQIVVDIGTSSAQNRLNVLIRQANQLIRLLQDPIIININSGLSQAQITRLQAQVAALKAQLDALRNAGSGSGGGGGSGAGDGGTGLITAGLSAAIAKAVVLLYTLKQIADAVMSIVMPGFDFTKDMEINKLGMAGIIQSMTLLNGKAVSFGEAMQISADITAKLQKDAIRTGATMEELVTVYRAILAPGIGSGMKIDEIQKITTMGANAVKAIMPGSGKTQMQLVQEVRDLVQGGITPGASTLATSLGITDADITKAKASADGLFKYLNAKLSGFDDVSKAFPDTLQGKMDNLQEVATLASAQITEAFGGEIADTLTALMGLFGELDTKAGTLVINPVILQSIQGLKQTTEEWITVWKGIDLGSGPADTLKITWGVLKDIGGIVADTAGAFRGLGNSSGLFAGLNSTLKDISSGIKSVAGVITEWKSLPTIIMDVTLAFGAFKLATKLGAVVDAIGIAAIAIEASMLRIRTALAAATFSSLGASIASALNLTAIATNMTNAASVIKMAFLTISKASLAFIATPAGAALLAIAAAAGYVASKYYEIKDAQSEATEAQKNAADMENKLTDVRKKQQEDANKPPAPNPDDLTSKFGDNAEKQLKKYQEVVNKQAELGQYVYASQKLLAEANAIEKSGGDGTVKRYGAMKAAITDYLSEIEKVATSAQNVSSSMTQMNIVLAGIVAPTFTVTGSIWNDRQKEVVGYRQAVGFNLQQIEFMNQQQDSFEKVNNVNKLNDRLGILRAMLSSEKLGAEQRKQLITEEKSIFASYTKSIADGIQDAMSKIQSLQSKAISSASAVMGVLDKFFPESSYRGMKTMLAVAEDAWSKTKTHSVEQMNALLGLQARAKELNINPSIKINASDVIAAGMSEVSEIGNTINTLKENMNALIDQAKQIGWQAADNYFAEWNGYIDQLKQTIGGALSTIVIDPTQINQAINQAKQQIDTTVQGMQTNVAVDMPKQQINYNNFQQTFQVGVSIQGNTLKDLGDAVDNARNLFGQELKSAFEEANAQYGF